MVEPLMYIDLSCLLYIDYALLHKPFIPVGLKKKEKKRIYKFVLSVHYTAWTALHLYYFQVDCAAHNTAHTTPTSSCTDQDVIVSMAGRPVLRR